MYKKYLDTVDAAISTVHSKWWSGDYYSKVDYETDLGNLIELRSFVEEMIDNAPNNN